MDNTLKRTPTVVANESESIFSGKNGIITFLVLLVILSFLGINLLVVSGNIFDQLKDTFLPWVEKLFAMFGYSGAILLDKTADASTDAIKFSADIANGAVGSLSDLMIKASKQKLDGDEQLSLDKTLTFNKPLCSSSPQPDSAVSNTQTPISSGKQQWCLVEENGAQRQCLAIDQMDKCMSGQVFPTQRMCLNPNIQSA